MASENGVPVQVPQELMEHLQAIEAHAHANDIDGFTVAAIVDGAVRSFLAALVALIDRTEGSPLPPLPPDDDEGSVRLDGELLFELDCVVAEIAAHGLGEATRGRLVAAAVRAYLRGFHEDLARDE